MSGLLGEPVSNRMAAAMLLQRSKGAVGNDRMSDGEVDLHRIALVLQALTHAVLAFGDREAYAAEPAPAAAAPADRALYRDRDGDLWTCSSTGRPFLLHLDGLTWNTGIRRHLSEVEAELGPLHVVPWPGEVR